MSHIQGDSLQPFARPSLLCHFLGCNRSFRNASGLTQHIRAHHSGPSLAENLNLRNSPLNTPAHENIRNDGSNSMPVIPFPSVDDFDSDMPAASLEHDSNDLRISRLEHSSSNTPIELLHDDPDFLPPTFQPWAASLDGSIFPSSPHVDATNSSGPSRQFEEDEPGEGQPTAATYISDRKKVKKQFHPLINGKIIRIQFQINSNSLTRQ